MSLLLELVGKHESLKGLVVLYIESIDIGMY